MDVDDEDDPPAQTRTTQPPRRGPYPAGVVNLLNDCHNTQIYGSQFNINVNQGR